MGPTTEELGRRLGLTAERTRTPELMDEAALSPLLSANAALIHHNTHNYIIINKINDVCDLCETSARLTVDHGADRRVPALTVLIKVTETDVLRYFAASIVNDFRCWRKWFYLAGKSREPEFSLKWRRRVSWCEVM